MSATSVFFMAPAQDPIQPPTTNAAPQSAVRGSTVAMGPAFLPHTYSPVTRRNFGVTLLVYSIMMMALFPVTWPM
jgi:hypothetical protein